MRRQDTLLGDLLSNFAVRNSQYVTCIVTDHNAPTTPPIAAHLTCSFMLNFLFGEYYTGPSLEYSRCIGKKLDLDFFCLAPVEKC